MIRTILLAAALALGACASGTTLMTGTARTATDPASIQIYTSPPAHYEVIGIVTATSDTGFTSQQSQNYALEEMRNRAAAVGANGILLESAGTVSQGATGVMAGTTLLMVPNDAQQVRGQAIYVTP